jgi:hypothetical protein
VAHNRHLAERDYGQAAIRRHLPLCRKEPTSGT